ncbi:MAG: M12 family metallo-peptidase [Hyphomicrobiaceae bacterium]
MYATKFFRMMTRRAWLCVALVVVALFGGGDPAAAQGQAKAPAAAKDEMISAFIAFLPPHDSVEYRSLRQRAGLFSKTPIPFYGGEVWTFKRSDAPAMHDLAVKLGATIIFHGKWHADDKLRQKSQTNLTGLQKKLVSAIGNLASAVELQLIQLSDFEVTQTGVMPDWKGKGPAPKVATKLKSVFDGKITIEASLVSMDLQKDMLVWRGKVDGTEGAYNIYIGRSGQITGEIEYNKFKYWLRPLGQGLMAMAKIDPNKLPADHGFSDMSLVRRIDEIANGGSEKMKKRALMFKDIIGQRSGTPEALLPPPVKGESEPVVIDLMVVYTAKAARNYANIETELIRPIIDQTNQSFKASGIKDIDVHLVHTQQVDYDETGAVHFDHVWRMVDRGDGYLEDVPPMRDKYKADAVILVVDSPTGCGLTTRVAPGPEEAYAVVHHECAALSYSLTHEFGHILGARHDRFVDKNALATSYAHGYVDPKQNGRTVMAYKEGCEGCPRLPLWSSPDRLVSGGPAGDKLDNNARVVIEQARRVSHFR